ncbi:hypothetical protein LSH36_230g01000, partial [Paralvinella palmiformis]
YFQPSEAHSHLAVDEEVKQNLFDDTEAVSGGQSRGSNIFGDTKLSLGMESESRLSGPLKKNEENNGLLDALGDKPFGGKVSCSQKQQGLYEINCIYVFIT